MLWKQQAGHILFIFVVAVKALNFGYDWGGEGGCAARLQKRTVRGVVAVCSATGRGDESSSSRGFR